jgi:inosose dehydratase
MKDLYLHSGAGGPASDRRTILGGMLAVVGAGLLPAGLAQAKDWSPSDIRYGYSSIAWGSDVEEAIAETARVGLQGIEGRRPDWLRYVDRPLDLKRQFDEAGLALVSCSRDLDFFVRDAPGQPVHFVDETVIPKMIDDHVAFAHDFIKPFGCSHFKFTLGGRSPEGPNDAQLKIIARALNEIGKQTMAFGIRLAPHPHVGGTVILEHEVRAILGQTDPNYVWMVMDTAHLTLAGMDPVAIIREQYPRVAEVHYKDVPARYRGWKGPAPTQEMENGQSLFQPMGTGGVDFPALHTFLLGRKYQGWILLDYEAPRLGDGQGTLEQSILHNKNYLVNVLHVTTLGPSHPGQSKCEFKCAAADVARDAR